MKIFEVYSYETRTASYESPNCPSSWRGSGCYDIDINVLQYEKDYVSATDEDSAKEILHSAHPELVVLGVDYGFEDKDITYEALVDYERSLEVIVTENYKPSLENAKYELFYGRV